MRYLDKYHIYRGYGKPSKIKDRLLTKLGMNFRGLITIIIMKAQYGYARDHRTTQHHYILDNTNWKKISSNMKMTLIKENNLKYEHLELEDYE